jgi:radical SAM superfamily enzyme YgiQ (UPF0313 family)
MTDITLVSIPKRWHSMNFEYATTLPRFLGQLKSIIEKEGHTVKTFDFAIKYVRKAFLNQPVFNELEKWFGDSRMKPCGTLHPLSKKTKKFFDEMLNEWVDMIISTDPKWVGISILLDQSITPAYQLCLKLREKAPKIKILLGGQALTEYVNVETKYRVPELFRDMGLCDAFIIGDAEEAILKFMKGDWYYPGINNFEPDYNINIEGYPYPDYSDLPLWEYVLPSPWDLSTPLSPMVIITQARGCPMKCNFCVDRFTPEKYSWREPEAIMEEIIHYHKTYGIVKFFWSDLTWNVNPKRMETLLGLIVDYCEGAGVKFEMCGLFTIPKKSAFSEALWELTAKAGWKAIAFGMESASQKVRSDMGKGGFDNQDIDYTIEMCTKYGISPILLTIVGYPTENIEDFNETLALIERYKGVEALKESFAVSVFRLEEKSNIGKDLEGFGIVAELKPQHMVTTWKSPITDSYEAHTRGLITLKHLMKNGFGATVEGIDYSQVNEDTQQ